MNNCVNQIKEKYIVKKNIDTQNKMKRNLQPEIEKVKSIRKSLSELGFISKEERFRLLSEVEKLENMLL
jgi:hypothetical protein